jgi:hypothetical protein
MANRILLQTLLRFSDDIKSGAAKVQDVITDYFNTTGKSVTDEERGIILKEFQDNAPSNVEEVDFSSDFLFTDKPKSGAFDAIDETAEGFDPNYMKGLTDTDNVVKKSGAFDAVDETAEGFDPNYMRGLTDTDTPFTDRVSKEMGTKLRGDETFGELMEMKESRQGLGSLYPKGEPGQIFDIQNDKRMEVAEFMKAMRAAGIKNEDVMNVAKNPDIAEGKRAATSLARAADMAADTKVKQELLSTLDDDIANYGPDWWKGMGYNEGPMGRESVGNLLESMTTDINNGVIDDLIAQGMEEDKAFELMRYVGREQLKYDPKAFIRKIADELEMNDIKYDMTFWDNYTDEILTRIQKPEPRFAAGGLV